MAINLDEILNYINPEPRYAGKLEDLGLLEAGDLESARKQSVFQGLLGAGLGYLAQPKNQGYGSIAPYLAKSGIQGLQFMKSPYEQLTKDAFMNQKLKEVKKQNDIEDILSKGLYTETKTGGQERPYKPITKQVMSPTGLIDEKVAPDFTPIKTTPEKTEYDFNLGSIQELVKKGAIPEATALMNLEKARTAMLKSVGRGMMLSDAQATSIGLQTDRKQKYFLNDKGKPELIAGQIIPFDQINKSKYERVSDSSGTYYIPKNPTSGLKTLKDVGGGQYIEDVYKKSQSPYIATKAELEPIAIALSDKYNIPVKEAYVVANTVLPNARMWAQNNPDSKVTINDKAMSLVPQLYNLNQDKWWGTNANFGKADIEPKQQYNVGTILTDSKGTKAIITGYNTETKQPIYQVIK